MPHQTIPFDADEKGKPQHSSNSLSLSYLFNKLMIEDYLRTHTDVFPAFVVDEWTFAKSWQVYE